VIRIADNDISHCDVGISLPETAQAEVSGNRISETRVAIEIISPLPHDVAVRLHGAITSGTTEENIRKDFSESFRLAGADFDTWLARAGSLASLASGIAQAYGLR